MVLVRDRASRRTGPVLAVAGATAALLLTACGSSDGSASDDGSGSLTVVASTDVWGDVAGQVAGNLAGGTVQITSLITDPAADPHSFEASTRNQLELSRADVVIENGGGYDDFVDTMMKSSGNPSSTVLNAVDISGRTAPSGGDLNEHVWYDFPTVEKVADRLATAFSEADPDHAAVYAENAAAFSQKLQAMEATEATIESAHAGDGVAITEPVPLYLLEASGLVNKTPAEFSEGIEEGTDVSASVLSETLDLFENHEVDLLTYNEQTTGSETEAVLAAAKSNGIPVVPVTETLPSGEDYVSWMQANLAAIQSALDG